MDRPRRADLRVPDAEADIYLVGLGIGGFDRRTVEADRVLSRCAAIAHLTAFDEEIRARYPASYVVDHKHLYESTSLPGETYAGMAEAVLALHEDFGARGPTAFLVYGHPAMLVDTSRYIIDAAAPERVKYIPGTSFIDETIALFGGGLDSGMQHFEANILVNRQIVPDRRFGLVVSQVGDFGADVLRPIVSPDRFQPLWRYIQTLYADSLDRPAHLFMAPWRSDMAPEIVSFPLSALERQTPHVGMSLLVEGER